MVEVASLSDHATSTSGDYQKFFTDAQGRRLSHVFDPKTGRPVQHSVTDVSVVASDSMTADALAATLFVLGQEEGLRFIKSWTNAAALFIVRASAGHFRQTASSRFARLTGYAPCNHRWTNELLAWNRPFSAPGRRPGAAESQALPCVWLHLFLSEWSRAMDLETTLVQKAAFGAHPLRKHGTGALLLVLTLGLVGGVIPWREGSSDRQRGTFRAVDGVQQRRSDLGHH